jgi:cytochrome P450
VAGFGKTAAATLTTLSYALVKNQEVQQMCYEEIDDIIERNGGKNNQEFAEQSRR